MRADCNKDSLIFEPVKCRRTIREIGGGPVTSQSPNAALDRRVTPAYPAPTAAHDFASDLSAVCELAVITGRAEFDALEGQWNALFERSGRPYHVFQTFNWLWHWANHYLDGDTKLSII